MPKAVPSAEKSPPTDDEDGEHGDYGLTPSCEHYFGRFSDPDVEPNITGELGALNDLILPAYRGSRELEQDEVDRAFGQHAAIAIAAYPDGFRTDGYVNDLFHALIGELDLVSRDVTGSMVWSCTEYFAPNPGREAALLSGSRRRSSRGWPP